MEPLFATVVLHTEGKSHLTFVPLYDHVEKIKKIESIANDLYSLEQVTGDSSTSDWLQVSSYRLPEFLLNFA